MEQPDDVFAASSSAQTSRLVDFVSIKEENHGTFIADCVKAYYQADQTEMMRGATARVPGDPGRDGETYRHRVGSRQDVTRTARGRRWVGRQSG